MMAVWHLLFLSLASGMASEFLAPMRTTEGKVDMDSVLNHVLLLEQRVSSLHKTQCRKSELDSLAHMLLNSSAQTGTRGPLVAFQVKANAHPTVVNNNEILKFDTVTVNRGEAYHAATGVYEAPVSGMYLFWANVMSYDTGALFIDLYKEGQQLFRGFSSRQLQFGVATITYITEVRKGEKVWFKKAGETLNIYGDYFSAYGGVLLHAL